MSDERAAKFEAGQRVQINLTPLATYWIVLDRREDEKSGLWLYNLVDDKDSRQLFDYPEALVRRAAQKTILR